MDHPEKSIDTISISSISTGQISSLNDITYQIQPLDLSSISGLSASQNMWTTSGTYTPPTWHTSAGTMPAPVIFTGSDNKLKVQGDSEFNGNVKIKGRDICDVLDSIEQRLAILRPNTELESKWDQLRELRDQYAALEKELIEKQKAWDLLQKKG